ncbi:hypothetical protein ABW19_dt0201447 [Dactylella cylindrospora]|nr:hypothetical protein ABW19_dt0201447 [Dactylella cylindrospora]
MKAKNPLEPAHKLEIKLEPNNFTQEKYELFEHYQVEVHKDTDVTKTGFKRFLCTNPFKPRFSVDEQGRKLGAYHQCYYLDGKLVAIAVLDLLPDCVSGVYFMYHKDIEKWCPGKLSALRETALAVEGGYKYYYMGYYIHSCPKMRYKCEYGPAQVLDAESYEWYPFDKEFRAKLDVTPYVALSREKRIAAGEPVDDEDDEDDDKMNRSFTVFTAGFTGVLKLHEIEPRLGSQKILVGEQTAVAEMLMTWDHQDIDEPKSTKHKLAEVVATTGWELADKIMICLSLGR